MSLSYFIVELRRLHVSARFIGSSSGLLKRAETCSLLSSTIKLKLICWHNYSCG